MQCVGRFNMTGLIFIFFSPVSLGTYIRLFQQLSISIYFLNAYASDDYYCIEVFGDRKFCRCVCFIAVLSPSE